MLSPRVLHFSGNQVFWECCSTSACESLPSGIPRLSNVKAITNRRWRLQLLDGPLAGEKDESIETLWMNSVRGYARCQVSYDKDRIIAIWSVAKLVRDILQEDYAVGLWSGNLEEQLAWKVMDCQQATGEASKRVAVEHGPSWSWLSVHAIVEPQVRVHESKRSFCVKGHDGQSLRFELNKGLLNPGERSLEQMEDRAKDQLPELKTFQLAICGYLRQGYLFYYRNSGRWKLVPHHTESANTLARNRDLDNLSERDMETFPEAFPDTLPGDKLQKTPCWFTVLAYSYIPKSHSFSGIGLILKKKKPGELLFCRTGSFQFDHVDKDMLSQLIVPFPQQSTIQPDSAAAKEGQVRYLEEDKFWLE